MLAEVRVRSNHAVVTLSGTCTGIVPRRALRADRMKVAKGQNYLGAAGCFGSPQPERKGLDSGRRASYLSDVRLRTMVINGAWNKRCGPGGSARRLHQFSRYVSRADGGETGLTRVVKTHLLPGMIPPLSGQLTSANDNEALAVAA